MPTNVLDFGVSARRKVFKGLNTVCQAVACTLGPKGRNVLMERQFRTPAITNDGVTIAKGITLEDKFENLGADLIKQASERTNDVAGDGTTTSAVITQALVEEGLKFVESGMNPIGIRRGMEQALKETLDQLKQGSRSISTKKEITQIATISSESKETGEMLAKVMDEIGKDGVITIETSATTSGKDYEIVKGLDFEKGYLSPYFVTNPDRQEAVLSDCLILVTDRVLSNGKEAVEFLNKIVTSGEKNILIIAEGVDGAFLTTLVVNKLNGVVNPVAVIAPEFGDYRKRMLEDIADLTGTQVFSNEKGVKLDKIEVKSLGRTGKVVVTKDKTTLINGTGDVEGKIDSLKYELTKEDDPVAKERIQKRIAKLQGGVAVVYVRASTETEMLYLKHKMEDAVSATKAAIEEGIVAGGGTALAKIQLTGKFKDKDFQAGYETVRKAIQSPLKQIANNTGEESGEVVLNRVVEAYDPNYGYNAKTNQYEDDMFEAGIVDPLKVTKSALENAVSIAGVLLTMDCAIVDKAELDKVDSQGNRMPGL